MYQESTTTATRRKVETKMGHGQNRQISQHLSKESLSAVVEAAIHRCSSK